MVPSTSVSSSLKLSLPFNTWRGAIEVATTCHWESKPRVCRAGSRWVVIGHPRLVVMNGAA